MHEKASATLELLLVIRFGSTAAGRARSDSDVDLAVLAGRELDLEDQERVVIELARRLGLAEDRIDLVDLRRASPLLRHEIAERAGKTPDSYRESFLDLVPLGILERSIAEPLGRSARLRNILVHEYDFDVDVEVFYRAVREFLGPYRDYARAIHRALGS